MTKLKRNTSYYPDSFSLDDTAHDLPISEGSINIVFASGDQDGPALIPHPLNRMGVGQIDFFTGAAVVEDTDTLRWV